MGSLAKNSIDLPPELRGAEKSVLDWLKSRLSTKMLEEIAE
jgi:hypothetical protein